MRRLCSGYARGAFILQVPALLLPGCAVTLELIFRQPAYDDAGVMPIMTYGGFKRMTGFCKTHVPKDIEDALESIKDNDEAVKNFGIDLGTRMCKRILETGTPGLHMYTLNTERSSVAILENLGLINKSQVTLLQALCTVWSHRTCLSLSMAADSS